MFKRKCCFCGKKETKSELKREMIPTRHGCRFAYYHFNCLKEIICKDNASKIVNVRRALSLWEERQQRIMTERSANERFFRILNEAKNDLCNENN